MTEAICVPLLDLLFRCKYVWLGLLLREEKANTLWQHKIRAMRKTEALMVVSYGAVLADMDVCDAEVI